MTLRPCLACRRHVREERCPFCGGTVVSAAPRPVLVGRWSRAAVFASASLVGCTPSPAPQHAPPPHVETPPVDAQSPTTIDGQGAPAGNPSFGSGVIRGTVKVTDGTPFANEPILLTGPIGRRDVRTDRDGRFEFSGLPAGNYVVIITQLRRSPRDQPSLIRRPVVIGNGDTETLEVAVEPPMPPRDNGCCMPYGAPPNRRRVV